MKRLSIALAAVGISLMVLATAIGLLRESTLFSRPPEAVAEVFVRQLVDGRYERAKEHLSGRMAQQVGQKELEHLGLFIMMRSGQVLDVKALRGPVREQQAVAVAYLRTSQAGEWAMNLHMVRDNGGWSIDAIGSARQVRMQESIFGIPMPTIIAGLITAAPLGSGA